VAEPDEGPGWRVRSGGGLLYYQPISPELAEAHRKEDQKERLQAERDAELRRQMAEERRAELRFAGQQERTQQELLAQVSWAQDRQDQRDQKADEAYREKYGLGRPRQWAALLREAKAEREAEAAAAEVTPASEAAVERKFKKLQNAIHNITGHKPEF
jgi:hypothetical protein